MTMMTLLVTTRKTARWGWRIWRKVAAAGMARRLGHHPHFVVKWAATADQYEVQGPVCVEKGGVGGEAEQVGACGRAWLAGENGGVKQRLGVLRPKRQQACHSRCDAIRLICDDPHDRNCTHTFFLI